MTVIFSAPRIETSYELLKKHMAENSQPLKPKKVTTLTKDISDKLSLDSADTCEINCADYKKCAVCYGYANPIFSPRTTKSRVPTSAILEPSPHIMFIAVRAKDEYYTRKIAEELQKFLYMK